MAGRKIVLLGDLGTDHEGFPPTPVISGSPDVLMDGKPVARVGDSLAMHSKPKHPPHPRAIAAGEPSVLINGIPVAVTGSAITCGGVTIGSGSGVAGGGASGAMISAASSSTTTPSGNAASVKANTASSRQTPSPAEPLLPNADIRKHYSGEPHFTSKSTFSAQSQGQGGMDGYGQSGVSSKANSADTITHETKDEDRPKVRVEAGIFFDGTGNNRDNTHAYQRQMDECLTSHATGAMSEDVCSSELSQAMEGSYLNAETNVSKLETLYLKDSIEQAGSPTYRLSVYIPGVGTKSGGADDQFSTGLGLGEQGILRKIEEGAEKLTLEIANRVVDAPVDELIIDVFGFSRGAATARHFVSREVIDTTGSLYVERRGALSKAFEREGIPWPKTVKVRFLGLFDTVAAVADIANLDFSTHDGENGRINVNLTPDQVERAVHFVAHDERRYNFSLTSLRGSSGNLPEHFDEWTLPGAHSDIGGGYPDLLHERVEVRPPLVVTGKNRHAPESSYEFTQMLQARALIKDEGWLGKYNPLATLEIEQEKLPTRPTQTILSGHDVALHLWLDRKVRGEYSRIPLYLMHKLAVDAGVPLKTINPEVKGLSIPQELMTVARNLAAHVWDGQELLMSPDSRAMLMQRYIHHSDHYLQMGPLYPLKPTDDGRRVIHPNKGQWVEGQYREY